MSPADPTTSPADDLVSVILPTYNRAHCITRAIDSALGQTHAKVEVVLIDDGSTDGTAALLAERYAHEPRLRYVHQPNAGVAVARNTGLAHARGSFIALLDSDDVWEPWKLQLQLAAFTRFPQLCMVWSDMQAVDPAGNVISPAFLRTMYNCWDHFPDPSQLFESTVPIAELMADAPAGIRERPFHFGNIYSAMFLGSLVHTSSVMVRASCVRQVGRFDEAMGTSGEDYDFYFRITGEGPVGLLDVATLRYEVGMADRLTRHSAVIARNALQTIEGALRRSREKLQLPSAAIRRRFAEVHAWLGEASLEDGERGAARRHLLRSLQYQPLQPRCARLLGLACVPPAVGGPLRSTYRQLKRGLGR